MSIAEFLARVASDDRVTSITAIINDATGVYCETWATVTPEELARDLREAATSMDGPPNTIN